jgi:hypothetical protein
MVNKKAKLTKLYDILLSENTRKKSELVIVVIAIICFVIHLLLIGLANWGVIDPGEFSDLLDNPLVAIYTPFSFILIYEVYLLVYYLPKSISKYIGKQYEIITLIVIRSIFNDLSKLEFTSNWFEDKYDVQFTYDILAAIILFFLIFLFYKLNQRKSPELDQPISPRIMRFVSLKKIIASFLVPIFLILAFYNLTVWINANFFEMTDHVESIKDVNKIFFDDFFTILILTDVILLLTSLLHTHQFSTVIRNSAYIISTILIKMSFGSEGIIGAILTVVAVGIGVVILLIESQYKKLDDHQEKEEDLQLN